MVPAAESGMAFVPFIGPGLAEVPCGHHERNERTVGRDNCVSFEGKRGTGSPLAILAKRTVPLVADTRRRAPP